MENDRFLETVLKNYVTPSHPTAFGSKTYLKRFYGKRISNRDIDNLLSTVYSDGLHKQFKRRPKLHNPFYIYSLRQMWQFDLIEMKQWASVKLPPRNDGVHYLLIGLDCFSRFMKIVPLASKTKHEGYRGVTQIIDSVHNTPPFKKIKSVSFDDGGEFTSRILTSYLRREGIKVISTKTFTSKSALVERANRTFQSLLYKFMTEKETFRYIDVLPDLLQTYNSRGNRNLKYLSPIDAEKPENQSLVLSIQLKRFKKIRAKWEQYKRKTFKVGDIVRMQIGKLNAFKRGYHHQASEELFKINNVRRNMAIETYVLKSMDDDRILGRRFYARELTKVNPTEWRIERVLDEQIRRGRRWIFVKWRGFSDIHNEWIPSDYITQSFDNSSENDSSSDNDSDNDSDNTSNTVSGSNNLNTDSD